MTYFDRNIALTLTREMMDSADVCSIAEVAAQSDYSRRISSDAMDHSGQHFRGHHKHTLRMHAMGAVISVYSWLNRTAAEERWRWHISNHEQYCNKHGYKCYFVTDSQEYIQGRSGVNGTTGYWMKLQAIRDILPLHPWVMFLDIDAVFEAPLLAPAVETIWNSTVDTSTSDVHKRKQKVSLYMPGGLGWITNVMLFVNTPWSFHFLEHFWSLRFRCPDCLGEQCAGHVALLHAMLSTVHADVVAGRAADVVKIPRDMGNSCCVPTSSCKFPNGVDYNANHSYSIQG